MGFEVWRSHRMEENMEDRMGTWNMQWFMRIGVRDPLNRRAREFQGHRVDSLVYIA